MATPTPPEDPTIDGQPEPDADALRRGQMFAGKYAVLDELGRGGFGAVYHVKNEIGWDLALKVLHPEVALSSTARQRFLREMDVARRLIHPNAVPIRDAGETEGRLYYTMEFVSGKPVSEVIKAEGAIAIARVVAWAEQVLSFLEFLHGEGYVHRDIKPPNIIVQTDQDPERVCVLDLGIAKAIANEQANTMLTGGGVIGTPQYMAPEQIAGAEVDPTVDLYALAVVLYECCSGRRPFTGDTYQKLFYRIQMQPPPPLPEVVAGFPESVWAVIERALRKDPAERYPSAAAFRQALAGLRGDTAPRPGRDPGEQDSEPTDFLLPIGERDDAVTLPTRVEPTGAVPGDVAGNSNAAGSRPSRGARERGSRRALVAATVLIAAVIAGGVWVLRDSIFPSGPERDAAVVPEPGDGSEETKGPKEPAGQPQEVVTDDPRAGSDEPDESDESDEGPGAPPPPALEPPSFRVVAPADGVTVRGETVVVQVAVDERPAGATVKVRFAGMGGWTEVGVGGTAEGTVALPAVDGRFEIGVEVAATDTAGQPGPSEAKQVSVVVDNTAPRVVAIAPPGPEVTDDVVEVIVDADEELGSESSAVAAGVSLPVKVEGTKARFRVPLPIAPDDTVRIRLVDRVGNASEEKTHLLRRKKAPVVGRIPPGMEAIAGETRADPTSGWGTPVREPRTRIVLVLVPATPAEGFLMGAVPNDTAERADVDERPRHAVVISRPFYIGQTEVSGEQWRRAVDAGVVVTDSDVSWDAPDHPVVEVSWNAARRFCEALGMTLPTEAQWEWACRYENPDSLYVWGRYASEGRGKANVGDETNTDTDLGDDHFRFQDGFAGTAAVTALAATPKLGLHHLIGNVIEWCRDAYDEGSYTQREASGVAVDPFEGAPAEDALRVGRGGSYRTGREDSRVSRRFRMAADSPYADVGFRVGLELPSTNDGANGSAPASEDDP